MKATVSLPGVLLAAALLAPSAHGQGCYYPGIPQAPDMCGPGFYSANECGQPYGPNYCVYPPYPPFQGMVLPPKPPGGGGGGPALSPSFPSHAFARSPRDYFMIYQEREPLYPGVYSSPTDFYPRAALEESRVPARR